MSSYLIALAGGALVGLAASIALVANGRVAGISGTLGRVYLADGGATFRVPFILALISVGAIAASVSPASFGAAVRDTKTLAIAGLLVGVGTALGNGCTSGHGVCGLARFSTRSAVAVATFMLTAGITVAMAGAHS